MNTPKLDVERMRSQLEAERKALCDTEAVRREALEPGDREQARVGGLSGTDGAQDQAMARAAQARAEQRLKRIDAALARIKDGSYGECSRCGEPIDPRRLEADPTASLCLRCAEQSR